MNGTHLFSVPRWTGRSWWQAQLAAAGPAVAALVVATVVTLLGWRGVDQAAQAYHILEVRAHGLMLWDSGWYAGNFPLGYSVLAPVIGAAIGMKAALVSAAVLATWSFDRVVTRYFGSRPVGTWYFAVSTLLPVTIGQLPFLCGEALGLAALAAGQRGRRVLAVGLGLLAGLFSPLAGAFLAMTCLAWAVYNRRGRRWLLVTAALSLGFIAAIGLLFPGDGPMPFPWTGLVVTELLCLTALTPLVRTTPTARLGALAYAAATLFSFLVPNPLGGNAPRLAASVGIPLLACFLTAPGPALRRLSFARVTSRVTARLTRGRTFRLTARWRVAAVALVVPFAAWQWAPVNTVVTSPTSVPEVQQSFYQPLVQEITALQPGPVRVEIPPTLEHWEAAFVGTQISLARGWERQLDTADNPLFYTPGALTVASYDSWLHDEGVTFVALPDAPLDYAAKQEAVLLRSGRLPDLKLVWRTPHWTLWTVTGSPGLVSGSAHLSALDPDHVTLQVSRAGMLLVRVRYTTFWWVRRGVACLSAGPGGWTSVDALAPGTLKLSASVIHPGPPAACPAT